MNLLIFHFLLGMGYVSGFFSTNASFIDRFGTTYLFDVYLGQGVATIFLSALFFYFADRFRRRSFGMIWFFFLAILVMGWGILMEAYPFSPQVFLGARASLDAVAISSSLAFWLVAAERYTHREAKRRFPKLLAAFILGDMAGGLIIQVAGPLFSNFQYLLFWAAILGAGPLLILGNTPQRKQSKRSIPPRLAATTVAASASGGRKGPVICGLSVLLLIFWMIYSFFSDSTDFVFNTLAVEHISGEAELRSYFGKVAWVGNGVIGLYHLFFGKRLLRKYGLEAAVVLIPVVIFTAWTFAYLYPSLLSLGLAQGMIYFFIDYVAVAQLNTSLIIFPKKVRGRVQSLTEGVGRALGFIALFAVARCFAFRPGVEQISLLIWLAAIFFLSFPLFFRSVYYRHLLRCLRSGDRWLVKNARQGLRPYLAYPRLRAPISL